MKELINFIKWCFRDEDAGFITVFIGIPFFFACCGGIYHAIIGIIQVIKGN